MKETLKYIALAIAGIAVIVVVVRMSSCGASSEIMITVPADSNFVPIARQSYRPRSTPFEKYPPIPVRRYPAGVKEKDVKRVIAVVKHPRNAPPDTTTLIEMKTGEIYVPKEDSVAISVTETEYVPPILAWDLSLLVGASFPGKNHIVSPLITLSPLTVLGIVRAPLGAADLEGIGIGGAVQYKNFSFGVGQFWMFVDAGRRVKLFVCYSI